MDTLGNEAAVVLALGRGPASGVGLMARLREAPYGLRSIGPGTLYPLLRRLEKAGLVDGWVERQHPRVGRPRRFQELTADGIVAVGRVRRQLRALVGAIAQPASSPTATRQMRANLRRSFEVSSFALKLHGAGER